MKAINFTLSAITLVLFACNHSEENRVKNDLSRLQAEKKTLLHTLATIEQQSDSVIMADTSLHYGRIKAEARLSVVNDSLKLLDK
jgi:hypothetical protein